MSGVSPFIKTIIITAELHDHIRGYPLKDCEFELKEPNPRKDYGITLDGFSIMDEYWVISKEEYMRVVPPAQHEDFDSDEIYIPIHVAKPSIRPCYIKKKKVGGI